MISEFTAYWSSKNTISEGPLNWQSQLMKATWSICDELNKLIQDIPNPAFEQTIFEYNERFFVGVLNNAIIRYNPYYQSNTIQEFSVYNDKKSVGRADLLGIFNNGDNRSFILFELKKWYSEFNPDKLYRESKEKWNEFFLNDPAWVELKEQALRYAKSDTFILNNDSEVANNHKLIMVFEHITTKGDPRDYHPSDNELRESIAKKYSELLNESMNQYHISFYHVLQNEFKNKNGNILDHMAFYGHFVE